jgi:hypothetical protein
MSPAIFTLSKDGINALLKIAQAMLNGIPKWKETPVVGFTDPIMQNVDVITIPIVLSR